MKELKHKDLLTLDNIIKIYKYYQSQHDKAFILLFEKNISLTFDHLNLFNKSDGLTTDMFMTEYIETIKFAFMKNNIDFIIIKLDTDEYIKKHFDKIGIYSDEKKQ